MFIIDACRYDIFKEIYREVFKDSKEVQKVVSPSTWTISWVVKNFHNNPKANTTYISSHKEINSSGKLGKIYNRNRRREFKKINFDSNNYFSEVIDAWDMGMDNTLGVVTPEFVCNEVKECMKKERRVIAHFWQIHDPYLYYLKSDDFNFNIEKEPKHRYTNLRSFLSIFMSDVLFWKLFGLISDKPAGGLHFLWRKVGREGILKGYKEDLRTTLQCIKGVIDEFPGKKFVITSDHGELLGENGRYGHSVDNPILFEVPWLEIEV